jgi:hypothetical protein
MAMQRAILSRRRFITAASVGIGVLLAPERAVSSEASVARLRAAARAAQEKLRNEHRAEFQSWSENTTKEMDWFLGLVATNEAFAARFDAAARKRDRRQVLALLKEGGIKSPVGFRLPPTKPLYGHVCFGIKGIIWVHIYWY